MPEGNKPKATYAPHNYVIFTCRLWKVRELRLLVDAQKKVCGATVIINGGQKKDGMWKRFLPQFISITAWGEQAEILSKFQPKDVVTIEGRFTVNEWSDHKGIHTGLALIADSVQAGTLGIVPDASPELVEKSEQEDV